MADVRAFCPTDGIGQGSASSCWRRGVFGMLDRNPCTDGISMFLSGRKTLLVLLASALLSGGCGEPGGTEGSSTLPFEQWAADTITVARVRGLEEAVGAAVLGDRVSLPSPYLTDYFGAQILQPLTPEQVRFDLVPTFADVVGETPYALTLRFEPDLEVVFRFNTVLYMDGREMAVPYARVEVPDPELYPRQTEAFRRILVEGGLAGRYLEPNPYFSEEQEAWDRLLEPELVEPVAVRTDTAGFGEAAHGVYLVDATPGIPTAFEEVESLVLSPSTDWLALEMFPVDLQPLLDRYLRSVEGSEGWQDAQDAILRFFSRNWNARVGQMTEDPVDNPYFRLIDLARSAGKAVVALDPPERYLRFRFGDLPLGAATRDYVWASEVPDWGRGVVYGELSHFSPRRRPNFLTFLRDRFPEIEMFRMPEEP